MISADARVKKNIQKIKTRNSPKIDPIAQNLQQMLHFERLPPLVYAYHVHLIYTAHFVAGPIVDFAGTKIWRILVFS